MRSTAFILALFLSIGMSAKNNGDENTDSTGLQGDNFDLYGALDLFKASSSLEDFEKKLNEESNAVNNLDLDQDGDVDYVRVMDNMEGDAHAVQLQVMLNDTETQDIAVLEIEKTGIEMADLQMIGNTDLYGENYIVEADQEKGEGSNEGHWSHFNSSMSMFNAWSWPCVRSMFAPDYHPWVSPAHYRSYPGEWHPWHPVEWRAHHANALRYHQPYYHLANAHRMEQAHVIYNAHKTVSPTIQRRAQNIINERVVHPRETASGHANGRTIGKRGNHADPRKVVTPPKKPKINPGGVIPK